MNKNGIVENTNECNIYGTERAVRKHSIRNWFLEKIALVLAIFELGTGLFSIIPSFQKKICDSPNCTSISCQMMQADNWFKRFVGNDLNMHGVVINGMLNLGETVFEEFTDKEEKEVLEDNKEPLSENVLKVKNTAIEDLKRLGLINDNALNFNVDYFRSVGLSLKDVNNINAISQIYAYELAVKDYDINAVAAYYKGIKCKYEDRYYESKDDFVKSIGFKSAEDYESMALEYIKAMNGEIGIGGVNIYNSNNTRLSKYSFKYNGEDRGISLSDAIRLQKQEQSKNMAKKAMGSYKARRYTR